MRLVIIGRKDSVIKVNGLKVSLAEVEASFLGLDSVADCCVFTLVGEDGDEVVAAVVPISGDVSEAGIRKALVERIDSHKRPRLIMLMDELPLTRNNKFDRETLARMARDKLQASEIGNPEHAPILAAIGKVLKGASIDINHSFFENGGNSLQALSLVAALKRQGIKLALEEVISEADCQSYNNIGSTARSGRSCGEFDRDRGVCGASQPVFSGKSRYSRSGRLVSDLRDRLFRTGH